MFEWFEGLRHFWESVENAVVTDLGPWSYVLLAVLVATEGPLSTLLGAAGAAAGLLEARWVFVAAVVGNIVGDCLWYSLGYMHKLDTLYHYGKWLGVRRRHLRRIEIEMHAHATKMIVVSKLAYGLIVPTLVSAGLARVPLRKWLPMVFFVETLWSLLLIWIGYHATSWISRFERGLFVMGIVVGLVVVLGGALLLHRKFKSQDEDLQADEVVFILEEGWSDETLDSEEEERELAPANGVGRAPGLEEVHELEKIIDVG